ncbi:MAG: hypothetical protein HY370_09745 [Proteobacteria bacterium]|nr:hypothetical protein [Pseudomonadota bacterium]
MQKTLTNSYDVGKWKNGYADKASAPIHQTVNAEALEYGESGAASHMGMRSPAALFTGRAFGLSFSNHPGGRNVRRKVCRVHSLGHL